MGQRQDDQAPRGGEKREKGNLYEEVTARVVAELEQGRVPWVQPWGAGRAALGLPRNALSGQSYSGPSGSRLIGSYDHVVAFGQSRALVVWRRIIMPDGSSIEIDNLPATDAAGYAGLEDEVDFHTWRLIKGIALATVLGVGTELTFGASENDLVRALRQSTQQSTNQAGQRLVEKNLDVQPTITVRPGWPLRVIVEKDLVLLPYRG